MLQETEPASACIGDLFMVCFTPPTMCCVAAGHTQHMHQRQDDSHSPSTSPTVLLQVEDLDLALRKKDKEAALSKLNVAKSSLDTVIANLL